MGGYRCPQGARCWGTSPEPLGGCFERVSGGGTPNPAWGAAKKEEVSVNTVWANSDFSLRWRINCPTITKGLIHPCSTWNAIFYMWSHFPEGSQIHSLPSPTGSISREMHFSGSLPSGFLQSFGQWEVGKGVGQGLSPLSFCLRCSQG